MCYVFASSFLRIPLHKHKSMREALREKGIELPYQDPALKYQTDEFAGSANMYINNYADVRNTRITALLHTSNILLKALTD